MSRAVLLVPAPSWAEALLKGGPCGARVPAMHLLGGEFDPPEWTAGPSDGRRWPVVGGPALVLAFAGVVVPEGMDRLARVLASVCLSRDKKPLFPFVHGGGGLTFGRCLMGRWHLHDVVGTCAEFDVPGDEIPTGDTDLSYPLALATVAASRGLGEVVT